MNQPTSTATSSTLNNRTGVRVPRRLVGECRPIAASINPDVRKALDRLAEPYPAAAPTKPIDDACSEIVPTARSPGRSAIIQSGLRAGTLRVLVPADVEERVVAVDRPSWAPEGVDVDMPSPARMYDALLGGSHNFEADRRAMEMAVAQVPDLPRVAWSNRAFLRRSVRFMVGAGIQQFLDIGSGIPTAGNVHEVAWEVDPQCRVQYVDLDSVAVAHSQAILAGQERAAAIEGDLRAPKELVADPRLRTMIDLTQPVGILLVAVLHLLSDDEDPRGVVATIRDSIPPGSYIAISHLSSAHRPEDAMQLGEQAKSRTGIGIYFRSREEIAAMFDGLTVVEPGVVELALWRPESADDIYEEPGRSLGLAGVGRRD